jgi:hypothetical protein
MQKLFNTIIVVLSLILCVFSLLAFVLVNIELSKHRLQIDLTGLNNYLIEVGKFKELYAATITLIVAYFAIQRLYAAEIANKDKVKLDRFSDWKNISELRMNEITPNNSFFKREFSRVRYNFFNELYDSKMSINNKTELTKIYNNHFKDLTKRFEEQTKSYISRGGYYENLDTAFFLDDFYFVFVGCVDKSYENIANDFKEVYLSNLDPNRLTYSVERVD